MTIYGQYLACGSSVSEETGSPAILFRPDGGDWTKVHTNTIASTYAFTGIDGLIDGSLIVAVGNQPLHAAGNPGSVHKGALSYFDGTWHDVAVPSNIVIRSVCVLSAELVYLGGSNGQYSGVSQAAKIWTWSPSAPTTFNEVLSVPSVTYGIDFPQFQSIVAPSASDIWAAYFTRWNQTLGRGDGRLYHFTGSSWEGPFYINDNVWNRPNYYLDFITDDNVYYSGAGYSNSNDYFCWYDGSWAWNASGSNVYDNAHGVVIIDGQTALNAWADGQNWRVTKITNTTTQATVLTSSYGWAIGLHINPDRSLITAFETDEEPGTADVSKICESTDDGDTWTSWANIEYDGGIKAFFVRDAFTAMHILETVAVIAEDGGYSLEIDGELTESKSFPAGTELEIYIGPDADEDTDELCYGGEGYGYNPVSADGSMVSIVTPQLAVGTHKLSWRPVGGGNLAELAEITVVERNWPHRQFGHKASFPPWADLGPSRLDSETLRDEEVEPPTPTAPATWGAGGRWGISTWNTAP